ncbi:hypothetical protein F5888DRAFT_1660911 [Russula emetica]|nr:hypothetical protein F5888DRAFT_1660911 [Russula emetica]
MTCALSAWAKGDYLSIYLSIYLPIYLSYTYVTVHPHTRTQAPGAPARQLYYKVKGTKKKAFKLLKSQTFDCIRTTFKNPPTLGHFPAVIVYTCIYTAIICTYCTYFEKGKLKEKREAKKKKSLLSGWPLEAFLPFDFALK